MTAAFDYEDHNVQGANGTIAEQQDEAYYDDRSDADDDLEKGRIRFPQNILYGRERELETLLKTYDDLANGTGNISDFGETINAAEAEEKVEISAIEPISNVTPPFDPYRGSCVFFLSGYSGVGKSALVQEFVKQIQSKYQSSECLGVLSVSGKYTEQNTASVPFSAIAEALEQLAVNLSTDGSNKNEKRGYDLTKIKESDLIGPGKDGSRILRSTFTSIAPLLDLLDRVEYGSEQRKPDDKSNHTLHPCLNSIKECTLALLAAICEKLDHPFVLFLDDLQWGDDASLEMLSLLLSSTKLRNVMFICAYRSNEVDAHHPFTKLMENVAEARGGKVSKTPPASVKKMDLFSLSPESITKFIADSVKHENTEEVAELAEAVYTKTMGNIFFVMQALEELVRKNILFYDVMCFEWRWVVSQVELANYMSDDVVESVKGKVRELSTNLQNLLVAMSYIPHGLDVSKLAAIMSHGQISFTENAMATLLNEASVGGMLMYSTKTNNYVFSHDRIRQAARDIASEKDQDDLLLHISRVLINFARGPDFRWCLHVAVDLLNSLPFETTNYADLNLIELNLRVSKIARKGGSRWKEHELLQKALKCLEASGTIWKEYGLTLEIYNAVIVSEFSLGFYDRAHEAIDKVLRNAKWSHDKVPAFFYQLKSKQEQTSDLSQCLNEGIKILNLYGFGIPALITTKYKVTEGMKLKMALGKRSYSCLTKLPLKDEPIFKLIWNVQLNMLFTSNIAPLVILSWKAIRYAMKRGIGRHFPLVISMFGGALSKQGKLKSAQELGQISIALLDNVPNDVEISAITQAFAYSVILPQLQSFRSMAEPLYRCYRDLNIIGGYVEAVLGSLLSYFYSVFAAGIELGPLLESKLLLSEELCRDLGKDGFLTIFQASRQFALNLRLSMENPTELEGKAFREEEALNAMNSNARKMALRDSTSFRLQLAFIFWNEDAMDQMLKILCDYSGTDVNIARLHNRLCFTGLAAFALGKRNGVDSFLTLGENCLNHFSNLTKYGSDNARPVYLFMLAMKRPSKEAYGKAIDACSEASMIHLEAMAKERFAAFLIREKNAALANEYITSSYWLYQDWGAHAKALHLSQQHEFLKHSKRDGAKSTLTSTTFDDSLSKVEKSKTAYMFNTTLKSRKKILLK